MLIGGFIGGLVVAWIAVVVAEQLREPTFGCDFVSRMQSEISLQLVRTERKVDRMSNELKALADKVAQTVSTMDSAAELIAGLAQQIRDNATDPAALMALAAELDAERQQLADAVAENTMPTPATV